MLLGGRKSVVLDLGGLLGGGRVVGLGLIGVGLLRMMGGGGIVGTGILIGELTR